MTKVGKTVKPKTVKPKTTSNKQLTCAACGEPKNEGEYYVSYNSVHTTGRIPYCKTCLKKMISDDNGIIDINKLKETLRLIGKPFLYDLWQTSVDDNDDTFGVYMKNLALKHNRYLDWKDSMFKPSDDTGEIEDESVQGVNFKVTNEIINKWGEGYKPEEYRAFERKYEFLKNNYPEKTSLHTEALLNYIRYRCKEELATAKGDVKEAKEWSSIAAKAATDAKINPSQLSAADLQGGLNSFSEISLMCEQAVDIIKVLPEFKYRPVDAADFIMWCYLNYERDAQGLPMVEYRDVWQFYDKRKKEYIDQYGDPYGIFTDDPTEKNRPNIEKFIILPKDEISESNE